MPNTSLKILNYIIRLGVVSFVGFSLYLIYTNYAGFGVAQSSYQYNDTDTRPTSKSTVTVTAAN